MLSVFLVIFSVMLITMLIMAVGVIFGREPIKGSCGGLNNIGIERACGCKNACEQTDKNLQTNDNASAELNIYKSGKSI